MKLDTDEINIYVTENCAQVADGWYEWRYEGYINVGDGIGGVVGYSDQSRWDAAIQARTVLESLGVDLDHTPIRYHNVEFEQA